jgi:hypothetical protein
MMATDEDRWRWVKAAIVLLRDEGLKFNPASPDIHRELAWLFELKIGANLDVAAPLYRRLWREIVADVESRGAWDELGMDPMLMNEIESRFDVTDRGDAQYSAIYWAYRGIKAANGADTGMLEEIVRQACIIYAKGKREAFNG